MATVYRQGDQGAVVKQIQKALKQAGLGVIDDGIWGPITTEAVKAFQRRNGLKADGLAGPATIAELGIASMIQTLTPSIKTNFTMNNGVVLKKSKRRIDYIVVHCTADREGQAKTVEQIRAEHKRRGWADIGYHYVVTLDGKAHLGRDVDIIGAHVSGYNANSIGVAYVGGLEDNPVVSYNLLKPKDTRTLAQKASLRQLLEGLRQLYPYARIVGHRDLSPDKNHNGTIEPSEWVKSCPSFDAKAEYKNV